MNSEHILVTAFAAIGGMGGFVAWLVKRSDKSRDQLQTAYLESVSENAKASQAQAKANEKQAEANVQTANAMGALASAINESTRVAMQHHDQTAKDHQTMCKLFERFQAKEAKS